MKVDLQVTVKKLDRKEDKCAKVEKDLHMSKHKVKQLQKIVMDLR
jgi:hypothetical protein